MVVTFGDEAVWVGERSSVFFRANVDGRTVKCFVSREALDDAFGDDAGDYIVVFTAHRDKVHAIARTLIQSGRVSADGELVISTKSLQ